MGRPSKCSAECRSTIELAVFDYLEAFTTRTAGTPPSARPHPLGSSRRTLHDKLRP